jgi:ABC-type Zn uptake system ZnuABC Zn-binding protein ZnuA
MDSMVGTEVGVALVLELMEEIVSRLQNLERTQQALYQMVSAQSPRPYEDHGRHRRPDQPWWGSDRNQVTYDAEITEKLIEKMSDHLNKPNLFLGTNA